MYGCSGLLVCRAYPDETGNLLSIVKIGKTAGSDNQGCSQSDAKPDKVALSSTDTKKEEQVARYLCVCYPLSSVKINSPYGYRKDPFTGKRKFHNGIDLHARSAKVFAMMHGRVLKVGEDKVSGKYVTLQHGSFTVSYYHLSQIFVSQGQVVLPGDVVGITGNTESSTGEHLHITCKFNGNSIDPMLFLKLIEDTQQSCVAALTVL